MRGFFLYNILVCMVNIYGSIFNINIFRNILSNNIILKKHNIFLYYKNITYLNTNCSFIEEG